MKTSSFGILFAIALTGCGERSYSSRVQPDVPYNYEEQVRRSAYRVAPDARDIRIRREGERDVVVEFVSATRGFNRFRATFLRGKVWRVSNLEDLGDPESFGPR